jgi:hypothetical protein
MLRRLHVLDMSTTACRSFAMRPRGGMWPNACCAFRVHRCRMKGFHVGSVFIRFVTPHRTRECKATNQNKERSHIFLSGTA